MAINAETIANLSPAKKMLLVLLIASLIPAGYWYLVNRGQSKTIDALRSDLSNKQAKLNENEAIARNLPRFKEEVEKLNGELTKVVEELPNSREIPNLLETISNLAAINGLEVIFLKPNNDVDKGFYAEVPIQVKVRGGYHEVGLFLDSIAKLPRIINVSNVTLGNPRSEERQEGVILDVNATATTYRYMEQGG
jgi:type IV pilus assembly protein PilO